MRALKMRDETVRCAADRAQAAEAERDRVRADLATEIAAHLETKQAARYAKLDLDRLTPTLDSSDDDELGRSREAWAMLSELFTPGHLAPWSHLVKVATEVKCELDGIKADPFKYLHVLGYRAGEASVTIAVPELAIAIGTLDRIAKTVGLESPSLDDLDHAVSSLKIERDEARAWTVRHTAEFESKLSAAEHAVADCTAVIAKLEARLASARPDLNRPALLASTNAAMQQICGVISDPSVTSPTRSQAVAMLEKIAGVERLVHKHGNRDASDIEVIVVAVDGCCDPLNWPTVVRDALHHVSYSAWRSV